MTLTEINKFYRAIPLAVYLWKRLAKCGFPVTGSARLAGRLAMLTSGITAGAAPADDSNE